MFLGSFVFYIVINNIILIICRKFKRNYLFQKFSFLISIIFILLLSSDIFQVFRHENLYRFFKIKKNFTKKELSKSKRELLAKYHPDKQQKQSDYIKVQEIYEIFSKDSSDVKSLLKSYDYFNIDLYEIYFDKFSEKKFETYQKEYFDNLNIKYYLICFMQLFMLKEIKNSNRILKILSLIIIGLSFCIECGFYNFYDVGNYLYFIQPLINQIAIQYTLTQYQVIYLIKRILFSFLFIFLMNFIIKENKTKKKKTDKILSEIKSKIQKEDQEKENYTSQIQFLTKKLKKLNKNKEKIKKLHAIFVIFCILYVVMNYYAYN